MKCVLRALLLSSALAATGTAFAEPAHATKQEHGEQQDLAEVEGQYRLVGVMETAAALRLGADGRFDWFMSVGNLDLPVSGTYQYFAPNLLLEADGAQEALAKRIALTHVVPIPSDLPAEVQALARHPRAIAVRLIPNDDCAACSMAFVATDAGGSLQDSADVLQDDEQGQGAPVQRTLIGVLPEGAQVQGVSIITGVGLPLQRDVLMQIAPGQMAIFQIHADPYENDAPQILQMRLERQPDGSLVPTDSFFGSQRARYVRQSLQRP